MNNKLIILISSIVVILIIVFGGFLIYGGSMETIEYKGKEYVFLEYKSDGFVYDYISDEIFEVEKTYEVKVGKWDAIYSDGDIFVIKSQSNEAIKYYYDDNNYSWYFVLDNEDSEEEYKVTLTKEEREYLYTLDSMKKEKTIAFDDIEYFGSIKKVSKDNSISGIITLAKVEDVWYWKSEVMMDDTNEYVVALPDSLNKKIKEVINS